MEKTDSTKLALDEASKVRWTSWKGERRKLMRLHHDDLIRTDLLAKKVAYLALPSAAAQGEFEAAHCGPAKVDHVIRRFEKVALVLADLNISTAQAPAPRAPLRHRGAKSVMPSEAHPS
jgi:hypothetical protein